jgi:hypothetical protein
VRRPAARKAAAGRGAASAKRAKVTRGAKKKATKGRR